MQPTELSFTNLIMDASPLVKVVMLILLAMSVWSWKVIVERTKLLKTARAIS